MSESGKAWLNVKEAAEYLHVSRPTLYNLMDTGLLPYAQVQGVRGRRIKKEDLELLLKGHTEETKHKKK